MHQTEFFVILSHFLPFYPLNSLKNEMYQKTKCTKNHDHRLYCSSDMAHDECTCYFSFWVILFSFMSPPPPNSPKNENFKKMKKMSGDIITSVPKIMIISYTVLEIWHMMDVIVIFHLGQIFCPFTP